MLEMPFASVEDVEARLGYELDEKESAKMEITLMDISVVISNAFLDRGKDIELANPYALNAVTAKRATVAELTSDLLPGQTGYSETIADKSISGSFSASAAGTASSDYALTPEELNFLGLGKPRGIYSIEMVAKVPRRRYGNP